jgi:hypothetical protein
MAKPRTMQKVFDCLATGEAEAFVEKILKSVFCRLEPFLPRNRSSYPVLSHVATPPGLHRTQAQQTFDAGRNGRDVAASISQASVVRNKGSRSPDCRHAQANHERHANAPPGNSVIAPALEHGNHSSNEE